jgi:hypothetical protein
MRPSPIALLLLLCLIIWAALIGAVFGQTFPFTFTWQPRPVIEGVTHYKIYRWPSMSEIMTVTTTRATVDAEDGWQYVVTSWRWDAESIPSVPITARRLAHDPVVIVTLQTSTDLTTWEDFQSTGFAQSKVRFFRLKIDTP